MANHHQMQLPDSGFNGSLEIGEGLVQIEFPYGKLEGKIKHYALDLANKAGEKVKLNVYKAPNGDWFDLFLLPNNPQGYSNEIDEAKQVINRLGI